MNFQLMNVEYTLSVLDINRVFQVPQNSQYQMSQGYDDMEFWSEITSPHKCHMSPTRKRPPLFVIRSFDMCNELSLASTVLARTGQGGIRVDGLEIMWCMVNEYNFNFAQFFLTQLAGQNIHFQIFQAISKETLT